MKNLGQGFKNWKLFLKTILNEWSSVGPEILAFVSHCSANFQPILDCYTPNFKLKYANSEYIKADHVDTIVFNVH